VKTSTIRNRAGLVAAGISVVALAWATPSVAIAAGTASSCCDRSAEPAASPPPHGAYLYQQANPLGFQGFVSPEQNSEEGTLGQGAAQVDAEVGAGEQDVSHAAPSARPHSAGDDWVVRAVVNVVALVALAVAIRLMLKPIDQIPRVGKGDG
jgi:hypothetical protein